MKKLSISIALLLFVAGTAVQGQMQDCPHHAAMAAQQNGHDHQHSATASAGPASAGLSEAQRAQYLNGEGMGMAKPAELNHYPGPRHVLDNSDRLKLSPQQLAATQALFSEVQQKAKALGRELVDREDELVRLFSTQTADEAPVNELTREIASLQGKLRGVHLSAHVRERKLLSAEQVRTYDELRNYIPGEKPAPPTYLH